MATAANDAASPDAVILHLDPDTIEVGPRVGLFWPQKAQAFGKLIAANGQDTPIWVVRNGPKAGKPWRLIAGLHRLEGVKLEGLRTIEAVEKFGDASALRRMEAAENLERRDLGPIERACHVRAMADDAEQRMREQHEGLSKQQVAVMKRWEAAKAKAAGVVRNDELAELEAAHTTANLAGVYGWSAEIGEALGISERSVFRDLALHRAIVAPFPDLYRDLARHPVVGENASALREIAAVKDEGQRGRLIAELLKYPAITVAQAKEMLGLEAAKAAPAEGATKHMNNMTANLARLSAAQQRQIAPEIVAHMKRKALVTLRDLLNARIAEEGLAEAEAASQEPVKVEEPQQPAVPIRQSVKPDYLVCLECGHKDEGLKRHLRSEHGLQTGQYLAKWKLPADYPLTAPNVAYARERAGRAASKAGGAK